MKITKNDIDLAQKILKLNLNLKPTDSILIVTDPAMQPVEGRFWQEGAKIITPRVKSIVVKNLRVNGQEPPPEIAALMAKANVVILQTTFSLTHTAARRHANTLGARVASLPNADIDLLRRTLAADYLPIKNLCAQLVGQLSGKSTITITNPTGTNLKLSIKNRVPQADDGFITQKGAYGNLPAGETMLAPIEGTANGVYVVEGAFAPFPTDRPIQVEVKNGLAINITGGKAAEYINQALVKVGQNARNIGELGIGTNPNANPQGKVLEAEKAYGTVHLALGNNVSYGGAVDVPFHMDGVILSPTLSIDNQIIIKKGKFIL